jgi:hypothetical protein
MTWAQRLKRLVNIDIETCPVCASALRIIVCIEDPLVIEKILAHPDHQHTSTELPDCQKFARRHRQSCSIRRNHATNTSGYAPDGSGRIPNGLTAATG